VAGPRIGITKAAAELWRFYEAGPWATPLRSPAPKAANVFGP
jgi:3-methyladenine DNA glycosylase Mpg